MSYDGNVIAHEATMALSVQVRSNVINHCNMRSEQTSRMNKQLNKIIPSNPFHSPCHALPEEPMSPRYLVHPSREISLPISLSQRSNDGLIGGPSSNVKLLT